jgi:hypothetical protein
MAKKKGVTKTDRRLPSSEYNFIFNDYNWINRNNSKDFVLHSLLVTAPLHKLKEDLEVFASLKGYKDLGFDLLVQREFDNDRVELELLKNFLNVKGKIHFFPPITVALIPQSYGNHQEKIGAEILFTEPTDEEHGNVKFVIGDHYISEIFRWEEDNIDSIESIFREDTENYPFLEYKSGTLQWDKSIFNAIVIDGQHRFLSLKKYVDQLHIDPSKCQVPLNFITLIPKPNKKIELTSLVETARELFIDINKNALQVSESRQILLDDRDLKMFLSRNSIRQYNKLNADQFYSWQKTFDGKGTYLTKIPQEIISWNLELSSNDKENYSKLSANQVTSTTLIYRIMKEFILSTKLNENIFDAFMRVLDLEDYEASSVEEKEVFKKINDKKIRYIQELDDINNEWKRNEDEHYEFYDKKENPFNSEVFERKLFALDNKAFDFDKDVNIWLTNWFYSESKYGKFVTRFYTMFEPFNKIISILEPVFDKNKLNENSDIIEILIDPNPKSKYSDYVNRISDENKSQFKKIWEDLDEVKNENLDVRNIIFQKSIFSNLDHVFNVLKEIDPTANDWDERIDKYIHSLNILYKANIFNRKDYKIKFSNNKFLEKVSESKYAIDEPKLWDGVWNDINGSILYKDSDAPKIGHYILILVAIIYSGKTLTEINNNSLTISITKVRDCYRTFYLNKAKNDREYSNQQDVWNKLFTASDSKNILNEECLILIEESVKKVIIDTSL